MSVQEYRRNQILLNLARSIFEEQNNLECLVTKIMTEARELLKCERCAVYLLDLDCCESVSSSNSLYHNYFQQNKISFFLTKLRCSNKFKINSLFYYNMFNIGAVLFLFGLFNKTSGKSIMDRYNTKSKF